MHSQPEQLDGSQTEVPRHVAVIMDGNGRWAKRQGFSRSRGHSEGAESVRAIVRECGRLGVSQLTLYAFSTENWKRPATEVHFLMDLLSRFLVAERKNLGKNNVRLKVIGRLDRLPGKVRAQLQKSIEVSRGNDGMVLRLALNYGGRQEIMDAARKLAIEARRLDADPPELTEQEFRRFLYDEEMTDPDLMIRTGGETRLSNFLLWQSSYTELYFTHTCWPEFREPQLHEAFQSYARRERRFGAVKPERPLARTPSATDSR